MPRVIYNEQYVEDYNYMPRVKTEAQEREKLRAGEQRRLLHALGTLTELINKHCVANGDTSWAERELAELHRLQMNLLVRIQNQHIKDERYAKYKAQRVDIEGY